MVPQGASLLFKNSGVEQYGSPVKFTLTTHDAGSRLEGRASPMLVSQGRERYVSPVLPARHSRRSKRGRDEGVYP